MPEKITTLTHSSLLGGMESMAACTVLNIPGPGLPDLLTVMLYATFEAPFPFLQSIAVGTLPLTVVSNCNMMRMKIEGRRRSCILLVLSGREDRC